ncbi:monocarboxylate transporter 9 isoform X2 [Procambarus clarkii]|uniref:monocarboxylate transporter 9 isoform X2 n=1 Tax=Procambarus clarkii TaxID=6728 RepID=UPI0037432CBA
MMAPEHTHLSPDESDKTNGHPHSWQTQPQQETVVQQAEEVQQSAEVQQGEEVQQASVLEMQEASRQAGPRPPDGGWGWMVAGGAFLITLVVPMLSPSFGILFSRQLLEWRASTTTVAIIYSAFMLVWKLSSVIVASLVREFGFRRVAMTGTLLTSSCLTISAFATSPQLLFLFFSLGCGAGAGLSSTAFLNIAQYFDKHRGKANSFITAGVGLGQFLGPLLIQFLQDKYGLKGATMILGAVVLHGFVGATLYQPVEWHLIYPARDTHPPHNEGVSLLLPKQAQSEVTNLKAACSNGSLSRAEEHRWSTEVAQEHLRRHNKSKEVSHKRSRHESQSSHTSRASSKASSYSQSDLDLASLASLGSLTMLPDRDSLNTDVKTTSLPEENSPSRLYKLYITIRRVVRSIIKDISILRHPSALIVALGTMLIVGGHSNFIALVPFAIQAAGYSLQTAAWCLSVAGACSFLTRMTVSFLSDFSWFNMKLCYMTGMATMGTTVIGKCSGTGGGDGSVGVCSGLMLRPVQPAHEQGGGRPQHRRHLRRQELHGGARLLHHWTLNWCDP